MTHVILKLSCTIFLLTLLLALPPTVAQGQREFMKPLPVTAAKLVGDYQRNFPQADAMYTGKLLLVTGRISTVPPNRRTYDYYPNQIYPYLTMDSGPGLRPLVIYLENWESQNFLTAGQMQDNKSITIMGFCQGVPPQLSLLNACIYPDGCGGPVPDFQGPYFKIPPSPWP